MPGEITLEPIQSEPAYRIAARVLRSKILAGEIEIGSVLPSETAMAELLQVNRSTVREAIRSLEENGVVARRPGGKKLYVTVPRRAELSNRMTAAMVLQKITVRELWGAMMVMEPALAAEAAGNIEPEQISALERNLAETARHLDDRESILKLDLEFHDLIADAGGNRALQLSREPISELFYPAFEAVFQRLSAGERLLTAHRHIVDALKVADAGAASEWMRKHIVDFKRGYDLANLDIDTPVKALPQKQN